MALWKQLYPRETPECIIALTCEPHVTSSLITQWAAEPRVDGVQSPTTGCPRPASSDFPWRVKFQSLKHHSVCLGGQERGDKGGGGHGPDTQRVGLGHRNTSFLHMPRLWLSPVQTCQVLDSPVPLSVTAPALFCFWLNLPPPTGSLCR